MIEIFSKIFGSSKIVDKSIDLIDEAFYTDEEEAENKQKMLIAKTDAKIDLLTAYAPFKLAQRYIAFSFVLVFLFIMLNGILGSLYGVVDMQNVNLAKAFANEMWLGEIVLTIVTFYFGGGVVDSFKRGSK